jgi:capsular polysaccharide transport system permease protein
VGVSVSQKSGIVTLHTEGYSPRFARSVSTAILRQAVAHMNHMNADLEKYYVASAEEQEQEALDLLDADNQKLAAYRSATEVYDPEKLYLSRLSLLNGLTMESVKLQSALSALTQATPHSPSIENIQTELVSVNDRIAEANAAIRHLSVRSAQYENLVTQKNNQMILLKKADVALQAARIKAMNNKYYFTVISQPSMPASPELPDRLEWIGGIFLASIILWGLLR